MRISNKNKQKKFEINKKYVIILLFVWLLSFFIEIWPIIFITFFCIVNAFILSFDRYLNAPVDIEFSNFATIIISFNFGLTYGLITAFFTKFADMVYNKRFKITYFFMISSYMVAAIFANMFQTMEIVSLGLIVIILSNLYLGLIRKFITQYSLFEVLTYGISSIIFNMVLFIGFASPISGILEIFRR